MLLIILSCWGKISMTCIYTQMWPTNDSYPSFLKISWYWCMWLWNSRIREVTPGRKINWSVTKKQLQGFRFQDLVSLLREHSDVTFKKGVFEVRSFEKNSFDQRGWSPVDVFADTCSVLKTQVSTRSSDTVERDLSPGICSGQKTNTRIFFLLFFP